MYGKKMNKRNDQADVPNYQHTIYTYTCIFARQERLWLCYSSYFRGSFFADLYAIILLFTCLKISAPCTAGLDEEKSHYDKK